MGVGRGFLVVARINGLVCCTLYFTRSYCIKLVILWLFFTLVSVSLSAMSIIFKQGRYAMMCVRCKRPTNIGFKYPCRRTL